MYPICIQIVIVLGAQWPILLNPDTLLVNEMDIHTARSAVVQWEPFRLTVSRTGQTVNEQ